MAAENDTEEMEDLNKMKVADLKSMLKAKGLSTVGNKTQLIERLLHANEKDLLEEIGNEEVTFDGDLEEDLEDTTDTPTKVKPSQSTIKSSSDTNLKREKEDMKVDGGQNATTTTETSHNGSAPPKKIIKLTPANSTSLSSTTVPTAGKVELKSIKLSALERKEQRALRFGTAGSNVTTSDEALKKRAERFGSSTNAKVTSTTPSVIKTSSLTSSKIETNVTTDPDLLKKRAERFGILSPAQQKLEYLKKLNVRKQRFSSSTSSPSTTSITPTSTATSTASIDDKKKLRAARFAVNTTTT